MFRKITSVLLTTILIGILFGGILELPQNGSKEAPMHNEVSEKYIKDSIEETGSFNVVSAIVLDYRGFDTLIESTVLFLAAIIIIVILTKKTEVSVNEEPHTKGS